MAEFHIIPHNFIYKIFGLDIGPTQINNFELIMLENNTIQTPHTPSANPSFYYNEAYVNHTTKLIGYEPSFPSYRRIPLSTPKIYTYRLADFVNFNSYYNWANIDDVYNQYRGQYYKAFMTGRTVTYMIFDLMPPTIINAGTGLANGDINDTAYSFFIGYEDKILYKINPMYNFDYGYSPISSISLKFYTSQNTTPVFYYNYYYTSSTPEDMGFQMDRAGNRASSRQMYKYLRYMCGQDDGIGPDSTFRLLRWDVGTPFGDIPDAIEDVTPLNFRMNEDFQFYTLGKNWDITNTDDFQYPANNSAKISLDVVDSEGVSFYPDIYTWYVYQSIFTENKSIQDICNESRPYSGANGGGPDCSIVYGYTNSISFTRINGIPL